MSDEQLIELAEIKEIISSNKDVIKPMFGLMFWQLASAEESMTPEEFAEQGMSLPIDNDEDEVLAGFMSSYIKLWLSARSFNAASRFVADCLEMSADELLQTRQLYLDGKSKN